MRIRSSADQTATLRWTAQADAGGMGVAFTGGADFSSLARGVYLSDVAHKSVIEVDETGTVAAAATEGEVFITTDLPMMYLTRPFVYLIEDSQTGEWLFLGVLMDPTAN